LFKQEVVEIFNELYSIAPEEFIIKDWKWLTQKLWRN
jgi:hypothetical protein